MVLNKFLLCFWLVLAISFHTVVAQVNSFESFDGTKIVFSDEGDGEIVLLIHGFLGSRKSWDKTELKKDLLSKGYRVIAPDLRGNGDSEKPQTDKGYSNDAEIKDLMALLNHLGVNKCFAVGYSRGSILLAKLLTEDTRIKKAVIGGMGLDFTDPNWERRIMFSKAFKGEPNEITQGAVNYARSINRDFQSLHLQQKHQPVTSVEALKAIKVNVLVIAGNEDLDNGNPKDLKEMIPNCLLEIIKGNHNDTYKTKDFSDAIISFLK